MAQLSSKQLNTKLTGSFTFSGSSHSFIGNIIADNNISGSSTSTGSFGYLEGVTFGTAAQSLITGSFSAASASFATTTTTNAARLATIEQYTGSHATTGSNTFVGDQIMSGSVYFTGSNHISGTIRINAEGVYSSSTAIYTNNITNGYPTSNPWGSNLAGSYFNNFNFNLSILFLISSSFKSFISSIS